MSAELVAFVRECFEQDERDIAPVAQLITVTPGATRLSTLGGGVVMSPKRAMDEIRLKQALLALHAPVIDGTQGSWAWFAGSESASLAVVKLLAQPYVGRPGFRAEWLS